jgi:ribosomal protein L37E
LYSPFALFAPLREKKKLHAKHAKKKLCVLCAFAREKKLSLQVAKFAKKKTFCVHCAFAREKKI